MLAHLPDHHKLESKYGFTPVGLPKLQHVIHFQTSQQAIAQWLTDSPGTRAAVTETLADGSRRYAIAPRDAAFAEVVVSADQPLVTIKTAWGGVGSPP